MGSCSVTAKSIHPGVGCALIFISSLEASRKVRFERKLTFGLIKRSLHDDLQDITMDKLNRTFILGRFQLSEIGTYSSWRRFYRFSIDF